MTQREQEQFAMKAIDEQLEMYKSREKSSENVIEFMNGYLMATLELGFMAGDEFNYWMNILAKKVR